jgi:UDP-3-O-[3-hydroxymyristoyl] glucosamine N-acyltransferase
LYNYLANLNYCKKQTVIHKSAQIHPKAFISEYNVNIRKNCIIDANATILPDVEINENTRVCSGAVIGADGFELKKTSKGIISVIHDGKVLIGKEVLIGFNAVIVKGFSIRDTIIGNRTKIDNLVYIAHSSHIGEECFIVGSAMICGSAIIGNNVWIGPRSIVSNGIVVGNNSSVSIGSVVTKNVKEGQTVTGNFAIDHEKFISHIKQIS